MTLRRCFALLVALGAALAVALPVGAQAPADGQREVRLIVTAFKQELSQAESYEAFRQAVFDHFDEHVAPLLADDKPNLVVYPERLDRIAMLIGLRGQPARDQFADGASLDSARIALFGPYAPQISYYRSQFDGLADTQYLQLALTDTVVRGVVESFADLARHGEVHLVFGAALPDYRQATDAEAPVVGDVEAEGPAYVATSSSITAQSLVVSPDGEALARRPKLYLGGREISRSQSGEGLTAGAFDDLETVDLPFVRLGVAAGRDALMPDVGARLEQQGAEILVQPLSHGPWVALPGEATLWPPDDLRRGTWIQVQRHPGIRAAATAVLTGALGSHFRDGQPSVAGQTRSPHAADDCLVGTGREPGWLAVGRWAELATEGLDLCDPAHRSEIVDLASSQLYTREEDAPFHAGAIATDVALNARAAFAPVKRGTTTTVITPDTSGIQLWPSLSDGTRDTRLAWVRHDEEVGRRIVSAASTPGGTWSDPEPVWPLTPGPSHSRDQGPPDLTHVQGQEAEVQPGLSVSPSVDAYVGFPFLDGPEWKIFSSRHDPSEGDWGSRLRVDRGPSESFFGDPDDVSLSHAEVALAALPDGPVLAVWSDLRWPFVRPQVRIAVASTGDAWDHRSRVDGGPPDPELESAAQPEGLEPAETWGQFAPDLAVTDSGTVIAAWHELSPSGVPQIHVARSQDGGRAFESLSFVDRAGSPGWRPALAAAGDRVWLAWESSSPAGRAIVFRRSDDEGLTWTPPAPIDIARPHGVTQQGVALDADESGAVAVFRDNRSGDTHLLASRIRTDGASEPVRVDDAADGTDVRASSVASLGEGRAVVAWQQGQGVRDTVQSVVWFEESAAGTTEPSTTPLPSPASEPLPATGGGVAVAAVGILLGLTVRRVAQVRA